MKRTFDIYVSVLTSAAFHKFVRSNYEDMSAVIGHLYFLVKKS